MQIDVALHLDVIDPWAPDLLTYKVYKNNEGFPVLCADWVQKSFDTEAKKITLHFHDDPDDDAYLVAFHAPEAWAVVYKGEDPGPILEKHHVTYCAFDTLLNQFPRHTAFLSITPY